MCAVLGECLYVLLPTWVSNIELYIIMSRYIYIFIYQYDFYVTGRSQQYHLDNGITESMTRRGPIKMAFH